MIYSVLIFGLRGGGVNIYFKVLNKSHIYLRLTIKPAISPAWEIILIALECWKMFVLIMLLCLSEKNIKISKGSYFKVTYLSKMAMVSKKYPKNALLTLKISFVWTSMNKISLFLFLLIWGFSANCERYLRIFLLIRSNVEIIRI